MHRLIWIIYLLLMMTPPVINGQSRPIMADTSFTVQVERSLPPSYISDYVNKPEYAYRKSILYETNLFRRYWNSFKKWLNQALGITFETGLDQLLFYLVIILAVIGLVYHLLKSTYNNPWQKKSESDPDSPEIYLDQEGSAMILQRKIEEYESSGNMRQALRYRYILAVWKLNKKGVIQWKPEMTNYQIIKRISSPPLKIAFRNIVSIYEHIWYGRYPINDKDQYGNYLSTFNAFHDKINLLS